MRYLLILCSLFLAATPVWAHNPTDGSYTGVSTNDSTATFTNKTINAADNIVTTDDLICTDCITDTEVTTDAGTSLSADLEEEAHCAEHGSTDVACTGETLTVVDDQHAHTGTTLSGVDISSDTNLAGDTEIVLTGDALSIAASMTRDSELHSAVTLSGTPAYITLVGQDIVRGTVDISSHTNLAGTVNEVDLIGDTLSLPNNAGTDITADLEEETHVTEHSLGGADAMTVTNLASACTDAQVLGGNAAGTGVECQTDATGGGGGTFGQATLDFGSGIYEDSDLVTVTDATVTASSRILTTVTIAATRDADELEMESFSCTVENIIALTSFDIRCTNPTGGAEGQYLVNFTRS